MEMIDGGGPFRLEWDRDPLKIGQQLVVVRRSLVAAFVPLREVAEFYAQHGGLHGVQAADVALHVI